MNKGNCQETLDSVLQFANLLLDISKGIKLAMRYSINALLFVCMAYFGLCFAVTPSVHAASEANSCISLARSEDPSSNEILLRNNCSKEVEIKWTAADGTCKKWGCTSTFEPAQNYPANGNKPIKFFACFKPAVPTNTKASGWSCTTQVEKPKAAAVKKEVPAELKQEMPAALKQKEVPVEQKEDIAPKQADTSDPARICRQNGNQCTAACDIVDDWASRVQCVSSCIDKTNICLSGPITGSTPK